METSCRALTTLAICSRAEEMVQSQARFRRRQKGLPGKAGSNHGYLHSFPLHLIAFTFLREPLSLYRQSFLGN